VLLVILTNLVTVALVFGLRSRDSTPTFDAAKMARGVAGNVQRRLSARLVDDLRSHYMKIGMTRSEILWILGPPDFTNLEPPRPVFGWDTGTDASLLPSDCTSFHVVFGPNGQRVVDWTSSIGED
jgi:hypothetical protein